MSSHRVWAAQGRQAIAVLRLLGLHAQPATVARAGEIRCAADMHADIIKGPRGPGVLCAST